MERYGLFIGGKWLETGDTVKVVNPYNGEVVGLVSSGNDAEFDEALSLGERAFKVMRNMSSYERACIIGRIVEGLEERKEELARVITLESGKPISDARAEVVRAINTFTIAMEETKRLGGEIIPLDIVSGSEGRFAIVRRFPMGIIFGITPFNFPLNLVAHKVAPALASGNTIVIKPSPRTPITAMILAEIVDAADLPKGALSVILCPVGVIDRKIHDERIKMLTFTGSAEVGWNLKNKAGKKKITLELGGNAGVIVHSDGDLDYAAKRCAIGAFSYAGQVCISVQRIYVQRQAYKPFIDRLVENTKNLKMGDPLNEDTSIAPMIDISAILRAEDWIKEAVEGGARLILGGKRMDPFFEPTILTNTRPDMKVSCMEAFAPVVIVEPYDEFEEAVEKINDSTYGLQGGVFTEDVKRIFYAFDNMEVGGLIINDVPTYRVDHMPYGGVKDSGFGREGVKYAIEEMTELRLLTLSK